MLIKSPRILFEFMRSATVRVAQRGRAGGSVPDALLKAGAEAESSRDRQGRVGIVDPAASGLGLIVLVEIEAADHTPEWQAAFAAIVAHYPQLQRVHCMTGEVD